MLGAQGFPPSQQQQRLYRKARYCRVLGSGQLKDTQPKSWVFLCFGDRMLRDHGIKARGPETVPTQHHEKDRNTNELRSLEP